MQHHLPGDGDLGRHVRQAKRDRLVLDDRLAERRALTGIVAGGFEGRARHADGLGGDADAPAFQVRQGDAVTLALLAQPLGSVYAHVFERQLAGVGRVLAELVLDAHHLIARRVGRHDEGADAAFAGIRVGHGKDDHRTGMPAGGDELLGAVDHVAVAVSPGTGTQAAGVRARLGFGQGEGADLRAARQ